MVPGNPGNPDILDDLCNRIIFKHIKHGAIKKCSE